MVISENDVGEKVKRESAISEMDLIHIWLGIKVYQNRCRSIHASTAPQPTYYLIEISNSDIDLRPPGVTFGKALLKFASIRSYTSFRFPSNPKIWVIILMASIIANVPHTMHTITFIYWCSIFNTLSVFSAFNCTVFSLMGKKFCIQLLPPKVP